MKSGSEKTKNHQISKASRTKHQPQIIGASMAVAKPTNHTEEITNHLNTTLQNASSPNLKLKLKAFKKDLNLANNARILKKEGISGKQLSQSRIKKNNPYSFKLIMMISMARTWCWISPVQSSAPAICNRCPITSVNNITDLLSVAGPFHTFLNYLVSTKVIDTFQDRANNTEEGITIFVPKDSAFTSLQTPLKNLTNDQLKSLLLFHALPHYYSLSDFKNLSTQVSPVNHLLVPLQNFTDDLTVHINFLNDTTKV
ncbi:hypothetical protein Leryth_021451 [Lithospermum erythrorhizon]|nr:hypothetical protein Leryth_021451 [Lithospermum erythrorhizon]